MQLSNVVRKAVFSMPSILYPQHVVQPPPEPGEPPNPHLSDLLGKSANPLRWVVETMFAVLNDQNIFSRKLPDGVQEFQLVGSSKIKHGGAIHAYMVPVCK